MKTREELIEISGRSEQEIWLLAAGMLARHGDHAEQTLATMANDEIDQGNARDAAMWLAAASFLGDLIALQEKHLN
ncbi:hypothetical protein [Sphingomonas sanxanigenens]|uniref:Uncharacterized protein n=1 Tax=Sphingomonas sanxanigenens DSM 19645 = NX02 TaxID=1123269 RepID=W0A907_9SPHN|nr:hypothetical protein [Sphingomonas sanxanigenens]AHE52828.1 hypothetical protein NX02_05445 [Sphingomonas sanxanigenens DSM 19645 = NX02]